MPSSLQSTFALTEHFSGPDRDEQVPEGPGRAPPPGQPGKWPSEHSYHLVTTAGR